MSTVSRDLKPPMTEPLLVSPGGDANDSNNQSSTSLSSPLSPVTANVSLATPWSHHHSIDSTLRFSEVSVPALTPAMTQYHQLNLQSPPSFFPTPSVGHLTHLFDITEMTMPLASQPSSGHSPPSVSLPSFSSPNQQLLDGTVSSGTTSHLHVPPVTMVSESMTNRDDSAMTSNKSGCSSKKEEDEESFEPTNDLLLGLGEVNREPSAGQEYVLPTSSGTVAETESINYSSCTSIGSADHSLLSSAVLLSPVTSTSSKLDRIKVSLDTNRSDAESFLAVLNRSSVSSGILSPSFGASQVHTLASSSTLSEAQFSVVRSTRASSNGTLPIRDVLPVTSHSGDAVFAVTGTPTSSKGGLSFADALSTNPASSQFSTAREAATSGISCAPSSAGPLVTDLAGLGMSPGKQLETDPPSSSVDVTSSTIQKHASFSSPSSPVSYDRTPSPPLQDSCSHTHSPQPQDSHAHSNSSQSSSSFSITPRETSFRQEHAEESGGQRQAELPLMVPSSSLGFLINPQTSLATSHGEFSDSLSFETYSHTQAASIHLSLNASSGHPIPSSNLTMYPPLYTAPLTNGSTHLTSAATSGLTSPPANPLFSPVHVKVPESVVFREVTCVGTVQHCQLTISNPSARWIQCNIKTASLLKDGEQVTFVCVCVCVCVTVSCSACVCMPVSVTFLFRLGKRATKHSVIQPSASLAHTRMSL